MIRNGMTRKWKSFTKIQVFHLFSSEIVFAGIRLTDELNPLASFSIPLLNFLKILINKISSADRSNQLQSNCPINSKLNTVD